MRNAKNELLASIPENKTVDYGSVSWEPYYTDKPIRIDFESQSQLDAVLDKLDFEYDNGYGTQELFGTIVFTDNTWLTRWESDGSEEWSYNFCPTKLHVLYGDSK